jgi:hypothetical protein
MKIIMQATSAEWKKNQNKPLTDEAFVEVSYSISDPDLPEMDANSNGEIKRLSDISQTIDAFDREIIPYATLEQDIWLLDGSRITVPMEVPIEDRGYVSEMLCDCNGYFAKNPVVDINFEEKARLLPGVTITWSSAYGDYPVVFSVSTYDQEDNLLQNIQVSDNSNIISIVELDMRDFHKIRIEIIKWNHKYRRARIAKIYKGIHKVYPKSDILKFSASQEIEPLSGALPKYEIAFEINNINGEYDPNDPSSLTKYMMQRQEIRTRYGFRLEDGNIEWIPGGLYFLSDWDAPQNGLSASFKARDLLGFLDGTYHKGVYNQEGTNLYDLAHEVLNEASLPYLRNQKPRWIIDEALKDITTQSPLPVCSFAGCLQLIANASGAIIYFDRDGTLHIKVMPIFEEEETNLCVDDNNSYSKAEINLMKPVKRIHVSSYGWQVDSVKTVYDGTLELNPGKNEFIIEYSDTCKDVEIVEISEGYSDSEGEPDTNKIVAECFAKCCKLTITREENDPEECRIVIVGRVIKQTETIVPIEHGETGETIPLKNILITEINRAREIGGNTSKRYGNRKNLTVNWRLDPSIDVTDFIEVRNGELRQNARVTSTSFDFGGAFKGKTEGMVI